MVWRSVYRRRNISTNHIRFREDIRLREDDIFHCEYISCIQTAKTCMKPLYVYNLRNSGAVRKKWGNALLENELALLEKRRQICSDLQARGYDQVSYLWYAASNIFAIFGIMRSVDFSMWKEVKRFIHQPTVQASIKAAPISLKKPTYFVRILLLKLKLHWVLFICYRIRWKLKLRLRCHRTS